MKRLFIIFIVIGTSLILHAQQPPVPTQFMLNQYVINPAYAGSTDDFPVALSYRKNWAGLEGAPSYQYLSGHMAVAGNMGAGIKFFNLSSGPQSRIGLTATYAYHIDLNGNGQKLAFGLSGLFSQYKIDVTELTTQYPDDALIGPDNAVVPDVTFGTYYYSDNYYIGFTADQLFQAKIKMLGGDEELNRQARHYHLNGGYRHELSSELSIEPSAMLKIQETGCVLDAYLNVLLRYNNMFWGGISFVPVDAVSLLMGFQWEGLSLGYSFDINLIDVRQASYGTHEVLLMYRFSNFLNK